MASSGPASGTGNPLNFATEIPSTYEDWINLVRGYRSRHFATDIEIAQLASETLAEKERVALMEHIALIGHQLYDTLETPRVNVSYDTVVRYFSVAIEIAKTCPDFMAICDRPDSSEPAWSTPMYSLHINATCFEEIYMLDYED